MNIKTLFTVTILSLLMYACGDGVNPAPAYTWGEAAQATSQSYCEAVNHCSAPSTVDVEACTDHSVYHMCTLYDTCDEELEEGAEDAVGKCVAALEEMMNLPVDSNECLLLYFWGVIPNECADVFTYEPMPEEEE